MGTVGIVIVTYNSAAEVGPCLDAAAGSSAEIVVVDNASSDGTREEVLRRGVRLIENQHNRGFAAAVNQGIRALASPLILLLNPDAVLQSDLSPLINACALPRAAGAGGRLVGLDGRSQRGFQVRRLPTAAALSFEALGLNRLWPGNPVNWKYRCYDLDDSVLQEVEQPAGAMLMIQRTAWEQLGGFDEKYYPLWFEDVDFAKRARDAGMVFFFTPHACSKHIGGHSAGKIPPRDRVLCWYRSLFRYTGLHFPRRQHGAVCMAVIAGSVLRAVASIAATRSFRSVATYRRVIGLAIQRIRVPVLIGPSEVPQKKNR